MGPQRGRKREQLQNDEQSPAGDEQQEGANTRGNGALDERIEAEAQERERREFDQRVGRNAVARATAKEEGCEQDESCEPEARCAPTCAFRGIKKAATLMGAASVARSRSPPRSAES